MERERAGREPAPLDAAFDSFDDRRRRQRQRIEELFRIHEGFLRRLAASLCRSRFDPDDLIQDMLERATLHRDALLPATDHRAWMARVIRNLFIDRLRRRSTAPQQAAIEPEHPAPADDSRCWWEGLDADDVRAGMRELSDELREPFELFAFHGCSYSEIAVRLAIPKMTVGTRILRARRRLKQILVDSHQPGGRQ